MCPRSVAGSLQEQPALAVPVDRSKGGSAALNVPSAPNATRTPAVVTISKHSIKAVPPEATDDAVDAAIARVLAAEQAARGAIAAAEVEAQHIVSEGRSAARRIAARAAQRVARVHAVLQRQLDAGLADIEAQWLALQADAPQTDEQQVTAAAAALARQLTDRTGHARGGD